MNAAAGALLFAVVVAGAAPASEVRIPSGAWVPFFRDPADALLGASVDVPAFLLDERPVTNAEFAAFVRAHPEWRRARIPRLFADAGYLKTWTDDVDPGPRNPPQSPAVEVSWFAAKAFCKAQGKTLPTTAQWERASAYASEALGENARAQAERIVAWYGAPTPQVLPPVSSSSSSSLSSSSSSSSRGLRDMHGLVWEWVLDFNNAMTSDDARSGGGGDNGGGFCGAGSDSARDPSDYATFMRYAFRASLKASYTTRNLGFRCAREERPR